MNAPEKIARLIARPMEVLSKIASPFVWLLSASTQAVIRLTGLHTSTENKVTEEEIKAIIQEGTEDGEIQEVEQDIVEKVFNLGDRKIGSIMTHRSDLIWLEIGESAESIRNKVKENVYTCLLYTSHRKEFSKRGWYNLKIIFTFVGFYSL